MPDLRWIVLTQPAPDVAPDPPGLDRTLPAFRSPRAARKHARRLARRNHLSRYVVAEIRYSYTTPVVEYPPTMPMGDPTPGD